MNEEGLSVYFTTCVHGPLQSVPDVGLLKISEVIFKIHFCVICFQVVDEFKLHARERKFIVREFSYNEADLAAGKNEITKLVTDKKKQFVSLFLIHTLFL